MVDVAGEMPTSSSQGSAAHAPVSATPPLSSVSAPRPTAVISSFPQYEVEDEERTPTPAPEAIKVTKVKKKKVSIL